MSEKSLIPKSFDKAVGNITDKPTKEIGQTLSDIWFLVFGEITYSAEKKRKKYEVDLEQYEKELRESLEKVAEEKRIEPKLQIAGQALESSKYCISSVELRRMFVNLISGSVNSDYAKEVHPSFPDIIKQLDDKDAKLLRELAHVEDIPIVDIYIENGENSYSVYESHILLPYGELSSDECTLSAAALERAGIITLITVTEWIADDKIYEPFKELPKYKECEKKAIDEGKEAGITKGLVRFTTLGKAFIKVCVR